MQIEIKDDSGTPIYRGTVSHVPQVATQSKTGTPSVQSRIDKAKTGDVIEVYDGLYHERLYIDKEGISLVGLGKVVFSGFERIQAERVENATHGGKCYYIKQIPGLRQHSSKNSNVIASHNLAMNPIHCVYSPHWPKSTGRRGMKQVFTMGDYNVHASAGRHCFYVHGAYNQVEYVLVYVPGGDYQNVQIATLPELIKFTDESEGCSLDNIEVEGAANSAKLGAIDIGGENHRLNAVSSKWSNSVGIRIRGSSHYLLRIRADWNGQMGWFGSPQNCLFEYCHNSYNNHFDLFDSSWEAGHKFVGSSGNTFTVWRGDYNGGPGLWFDIDNDNNRGYDIGLTGNSRAAMQVEDDAKDNFFEKVAIMNVDRGGRNNTSVGLQVQSKIIDNVFKDFNITGAVEAVRYKKTERRGPSGGNTFQQIISESPFVIEGNNAMPDLYENVPAFKYRT